MTLYTLLRNQIDIEQVPFSDRGSRLLVYKEQGESRLYIKLAERLICLDASLEAHLQRPAFIRELSLLGPDGHPLAFSISVSPALIEFQTAKGKFELAFQNESTLAFGLPSNSITGIRVKVQSGHYQVTDPHGEPQPVRGLAYGTNGALLKEQIQLKNGETIFDVIVQGNDDPSLLLRISASAGLNKEIAPFSKIRSAALGRWKAWFDRAPYVLEQFQPTYAYAWWVMANNLVSPSGHVQFEAMMPTKSKYIGLWLWDSAMHALAFRHIDPELARAQIRVFLSHQLPDGMLPDAIFDEGVVSEIDHPIQARVTKPPVLAWAALKIHESDPDVDFLHEIYTPLVRWNTWWFEQSEHGADGLAQYNHPYSSGLDDNPLWDDGMPVISPDLNTYLCIQMSALAQIAQLLGLKADAERWNIRSNTLAQRMIQELWDEEIGVFCALQNEKAISVLTPFNLYPLWTGSLSEHIQNRLLDHLRNPNEFWGKLMLPTVARDDPKYDPGKMWRGPVWANINYFFIEALFRSGNDGLATEMRDITMNLLMDAGGIHEYYDAETGLPSVAAAPMFGWTAAVFIDLAIQASAAWISLNPFERNKITR
jgi:putative isomerase